MPIELPRENWGERVNRAYRYGRDQYGYTFDTIARQITRVGNPISQQTVMRLNTNATAPKTARGQMNAWLILTAMGYEPADFGIKEPMGKFIDWDKLKMELDPARWCRQVGSSPVRSRWTARKSAGTPRGEVVTA